jgi:fructose-1,6-bisphosphatase I
VTKHIKISAFLEQHLQGEHSIALNAILGDVVEACKKIAVAIDKGAVAGNMGSLDSENIQGEVQKALDVITNDIFIESCQKSGYVAGMASEELVDVIEIDDKYKKNGNYLLM